MKHKLHALLIAVTGLVAPISKSAAQISIMQDYKNNSSAYIGTFQGINYREAGFSGIYPIPNTNGKEFWVCSDRGVNIDCANANPVGCPMTYDKMYAFAGYSPKIHRIRLNGDSVQILQTYNFFGTDHRYAHRPKSLRPTPLKTVPASLSGGL